MRIPTKFGLTFGFAGLICVLSFIIILSSTLSSKMVLQQHARTIMENIASYTIDKSQSFLDPARKATYLTIGLSENDIVTSQDPHSMIAYFYEQLYLYPQFSGIYFGSATGEFFMASRYNLLETTGFFTKIIRLHKSKRSVQKIYKSAAGTLIRKQSDPSDRFDPRTRPWYQEAKKRNELIWTPPYVFYTSGKPGITTANPIYDKEGHFLGVIGVDIEIDELSTFISKLKISAHGRAFIVSHEGDIIAYPDIDKIKQYASGEHARLTKIIELDDAIAREAFLSLGFPHDNFKLRTPAFTSFTLEGEKYNAMFAPFSDAQWAWTIGIYMPEDDYLGEIKKNGFFNIGVSLAAVIIAVAFGLYIARKLQTARERAEVADRAKSQFLTRMSHEIRTPINAILGAGELLAETGLDQDQQEYVSISQNAGEHLRDLVGSVLDISRIESGHFKLKNDPFDLHTVIQNIQAVFSQDARDKGLELTVLIDPKAPRHLTGDATALKQVLINLLSNAIKFTPAGVVALHVEMIGRRDKPTLQDWVSLNFSVSDTGIGISANKLNSLFDRDAREKESTPGNSEQTGLGLAICRHMVTLLGGEIHVTSEPGSGSTFAFSAQFALASRVGAPNEPEKATSCPIQPSAEEKRILLVEDDERNMLLFTLFLKGLPHTLNTAASGELALLQHLEHPYDLILMDIEMPGMNGYQTIESIREHEKLMDWPPVSIIAISAHATKETREHCFLIGCTDYVVKPLTKEELRGIVSKHLEG
ncbi:hybrid sensor histidine kinase/response regulator [Pseudodesulfovibrio piezophilus]|nr:hybrid sensor histidine kinase/response regulator [Pseudodesulfovibrio piezophilus]